MFKIKVTVDVFRGNSFSKQTFETMVDHETYRKLNSSNSRDEILKSWCSTMFPDADKLRLSQVGKV